MKRTGYILLTAFLVLIGVSVVLLNLPGFQRKVVHSVTQTFAEKSGTIIEVGNVNTNLFRGIVLRDVTLSDSTGSAFLKAKRIEAGIRILPLFRKKVDLHALRFIQTEVLLSKNTPEDSLNILPFIHSFVFNKKSTQPWQINFRTILLKNCRIFYDVLSEPKTGTACNPNHLIIDNLSSLIRLKIAPNNSYSFQVVKLNADAKCGINIPRLSFKGSLDEKHINVSDLKLMINGSYLELSTIKASYKSFDSFAQFTDSIAFSPMVLKGTIVPSDFSPFVTALSDISTPVNFTISMAGTINQLIFNRIRLTMDNLFLFDGKLQLEQLTNLDNTSVSGKVDLLKFSPAGFEYLSGIITNDQKELPPLRALGDISYMGNISTKKRRLEIKGDFTTSAGNLATDVALLLNTKDSLQIEGTVQSTAFELSRLFAGQTPLGNIAFNLAIKGTQQKGSIFKGKVDGLISRLQFAGYNYENLSVNGTFDDQMFEGEAYLADKNAQLDFSGLFSLSKTSPTYQFDLQANHLNLHALNLLQGNNASDLSFLMHADAEGNSIDDIKGNLTVKDIAFLNNQKWFRLDQLSVDANQQDSLRVLTIHSDLLSGNVSGQFQFSELKEVLGQLLYDYVPSAFAVPMLKQTGITCNMDVHFYMNPSSTLMKVLDWPISYTRTINLDGFIRYNSGKFRMKALVPEMTYGNAKLKSVNLLFENPLHEAKFIGHAQAVSEYQDLDLDMDIRTMNDQSVYKFFWSNSGTETHTGTIGGNILFGRNLTGESVINAGIKASDLVVNDTVWHIHPTKIILDNKRLHIDQFHVSHREEFIKLEGYASDLLHDTLLVSFNSFRLDDLMRLLPTSDLLFGGRITGSANCPHIFNNGTMNASLDIERFSINKEVLGNLKATTFWNKEKKALELFGILHALPQDNKAIRQLASASGKYFPSKDSLYLDINAKRAPLRFLDNYLNPVLQDMEGLGSGNVKIMGPMKKCGIYTRALVEEASFSIDMLNTRYYFSDSLFLTPQSIAFRNVVARDKEGNTGVADGLIRHNYFKDMQTNIEITANNLLAMDIPQSPYANFYGKAYGSGTVTISGPADNTLIDVNMRTEERTKVTISFLETSRVEEYNFIQFINPRTYREEPSEIVHRKKRRNERVQIPPGHVTVNLQIEATPNAEVTLITDPSTGDEIKARGSGAIRSVIKGESASDIELFGRYVIETGSYKFVYEDILRRDFNIVPNGSITFAGNPFAAELDIKANYTVDAKLTNLISADELASLNLNRSSIPVNCVLNLNGELQRPGIVLGIDFPSADEELKRRILNVVNTEEMLNQQIVYLLLFGRFNSPTPGYTSGQSNVSTVLNTAISTLSSQVNNVLNNAFGKTNLSFDIDYQNAAYEMGTPGEIMVGMSGQWLDDRLTIQGNLGSRENLTQTGTSQFIGEFDLNLRMKNSEKWSWKLFNRANDNMYFKSALNTQGFGLVYKEEYNNYSELFKQMVESLKKPFIKKQ